MEIKEMKNGLVKERANENQKWNKKWYVNNVLHRTDGPAAEYRNGDRYWYFNGELHRSNGPAVECKNGHKEWWLGGQECFEEAYNEVIDQVKALSPAERLTDPRDWIREFK
jgi:hypothetical protein